MAIAVCDLSSPPRDGKRIALVVDRPIAQGYSGDEAIDDAEPNDTSEKRKVTIQDSAGGV